MNLEKTLVIIKPDAVEKLVVGEIINIFEKKFKVKKLKLLQLDKKKAETFYKEHKEKKFFSDLVEYMCGGDVVVLTLEGKDVIKIIREMIGSTNPENAAKGTIRRLYGTNLEKNAIHASDSLKAAIREIDFFFN